MAGRLKGNMIAALAGLSCCAIANADLLFHRLATVVTLSLCFSSSFWSFFTFYRFLTNLSPLFLFFDSLCFSFSLSFLVYHSSCPFKGAEVTPLRCSPWKLKVTLGQELKNLNPLKLNLHFSKCDAGGTQMADNW